MKITRTFLRLTSSLAQSARSLAQNRQGNVAMIFAVAAVPMTLATGMGVDMVRSYAVKVQLANALDAAGLAVGSSDIAKLSSDALNQRLQNFIAANYPGTNLDGPVVSAMSPDPSNSNIINFTASAKVPTTFMRVIGVDDMTVSAYSQVTRGIEGLELALVLDNTGSMMCGSGGTSNCSQGVPPSNITSLKTDATDIIDTLFSYSADPSKLRIAVVPYVTAVNVGPALAQSSLLNTYVPNSGGIYKDYKNQTILDPDGNNIVFDAAQNPTSTQWKGCVIEPTITGEDAASNGPDFTEPAGGWNLTWTPYYWRSGSKSVFYGTNNTWIYSTTSGGVTTKHVGVQYVSLDGDVSTATTFQSYGPNLSCPTPLVRLTSDKSSLIAATSGMTAWANSGTAIHVGMIWGWRALSPNAPFGDGKPYNTKGWVKAVVLETDGINDIGTTQLTGLGYLADGKMGSTNLATAMSNLNSRLAKICTNMRNAGIVIYTIGLGAGATNSTLQNCAQPPGKFYPAPTAAELKTAFQQIAQSLNNLRLSK